MHEPVGEPSVDISESEVARRERSTEERAADHAAIERLGQDLLPALIAKLGATGLGELEVREGDWRVRLRRPAPVDGAPAVTARERRPADRDRSTRGAAGSGGSHLAPVGPGRDARDGASGRDGREPAIHDGSSSRDGRDGANRDAARIVAISPAVGVFQPRAEAGAGTRVRAGDRLGTVDLLGIPQPVVAPSDGVVGANLVDPGHAVEYGQELIVIEFATATSES